MCSIGRVDLPRVLGVIARVLCFFSFAKLAITKLLSMLYLPVPTDSADGTTICLCEGLCSILHPCGYFAARCARTCMGFVLSTVYHTCFGATAPYILFLTFY